MRVQVSTGAAIATLLLCAGAAAQMMSPPMPGSTRAQGTRVSVTIQVTTPIPAGTDSDAQMLLIENARKRIYQSTAAECAILTEVFKSECRLVSVNASSSVQTRGSNGDMINASGNAVYELLAR